MGLKRSRRHESLKNKKADNFSGNRKLYKTNQTNLILLPFLMMTMMTMITMMIMSKAVFIVFVTLIFIHLPIKKKTRSKSDFCYVIDDDNDNDDPCL